MGDSGVARLKEGGADGSADGSGFGVASGEIQRNDRGEGIKDGSRGDRGDVRVEGSQSSTKGNLFEEWISGETGKWGHGDSDGGVGSGDGNRSGGRSGGCAGMRGSGKGGGSVGGGGWLFLWIHCFFEFLFGGVNGCCVVVGGKDAGGWEWSIKNLRGRKMVNFSRTRGYDGSKEPS